MKTKFLQRVLWLIIPLLTVFSLSVRGASPETFTTTSSGGFSNNSKTIAPITVTFAANEGTSPSWQSGHLRFYTGNTVTISCTSGYNITAITINGLSGRTSADLSNFSANEGKTEYTWSGTSTSVVSENTGTGQARITSIVVTYSASGGGTTYTVSYNANGGSGTMTDSDSPYSSGATVTVLDNEFTAPSGYVFDHWNTADDDSGADYDPDDTFTISGNTTLYAQWVESGGGTEYEVITSTAGLEAGANYVIGSAASGSGVFMATTDNANNRRGTASITITNSKITTTSAVLVLELGGDDENGWTFETTNYLGTDGYLAAASGGSNYCQVIADGTANRAKFTISFDGDAAVITADATRPHLRYNPNNGSPLFACYTNASDQSAIYLYKKVEACVQPTSVSITGTNKYLGGQTVSLTAAPQGGTGTPTYQWQKKISGTWQNVTDGTTAGVTISGANTNNLTITPCTHENSGGYRCIVSTGEGCSTKSHADDTDGYGVHVFSIYGKYYGGSYSHNEIIWTSGTTGTATISLNASSTYLFKVWSNNGYYYGNGSNNYIIQPVNWDCGTGNDEMRLLTGPAGDYTFTVNIEHGLDGSPYVNVQVAYPSVSHPSTGYMYITKWWDHCYVHYWEGTNNALSPWGYDPEINSDRYTSICGTNYWYFPVIDTYNKFIAKDAAGDPGNTTGDQVSTNHGGKYITYDSGWDWHVFDTYDISFAGNDNTGGSMTTMSDICPNINTPITANAFTKTGYTFAGWVANHDVKNSSGSTITAGTVIADGATLQITQDITLTAQWVKIPTITRNPTVIAFGERKVDGSYSETFTVSASDLVSTNGLTLAVMGSNSGMYSIDQNSIAQTSTGTITSTTVTVTYHPTAAGSHSGADVRITTPNGVGGTVTVSVTLSGTGVVTDTYIDNIWSTVTPDKSGTYTRPTIADQDDDDLTDCQHLHYHFVGWITKTKFDAGTTISDGDIQATGSVTANGTTYYAVWAKADTEGDATYNKVTEPENITDGRYLIVYEESLTSGIAFDGSRDNSTNGDIDAVGNIVNVTISTSTIEATSALANSEVILDVTNKTIKTKSGFYIGQDSYSNGLKSDASTTYTHDDFGLYEDDDFYCNIPISSNSVNFAYNSTANQTRFRYYKDMTSNGINYVALYKYNPGVTYIDYVASCGETYDITLDKNGGTTNGSAQVTANATVLNGGFTAPGWSGHDVDYYMVSSNGAKIAEADGTLAASVTVSSTPWTDADGKWVKGGGATFYAKWKNAEYNIVYRDQNNEAFSGTHGTGYPTTHTYGTATTLVNPTRPGYTFAGWYTASNCESGLVTSLGATAYTSGPITLYAKWTIKSYTVTWVVNGETEATQASVSYGTPYGNLTEEPTVTHNAIKDACGSDRFVGWVWQEYTGEGGTAGSQFEPYKATASIPIDDTHHTFYAMFATENGTAFTLDGEVGSTQEVYVYYTDGTNNYYATGNIGASSTGKINSTTDVTDANTYVFTKTGTGTYTIKKSGDTNYIKYSSSTNLDTQATAYTWTITDVSSAGLGSWRLSSETSGRAWICRKNGTPIFGGYSTGNVTSSQDYRDVELGSSNLTDYRTGCCSEKITLTVSDATSGVGGTVTMKWNNADKSSGDQVSTCSQGTLVAKITANPGYSLTAVAISGTNKTITTDPANLATGLPSTSEMTYTVTVPAEATGTLTVTPTFSRMYTVAYDLDDGETSGSTTTTSYLPNTTVTFVTPNPTKSGYNFDGWVVNKEGGGTQSATSTNFSMPSDNVTVVAQWSAKPLSSITVTPTTATVYVGQYVELPVTYDPADILTKGYTLVSTPSWCVTTGSTQTTMKITGGRSGATINEDKTETVSIQANADYTKTASVTVTVKPLPVDHFVDLIHNVSFDDKGASIVNNVLQATYTAPGYTGDYSGSTTGDCETKHLHLVGWIDSEWADAHPKASHTEIIAAEGYHTAREAGMTASNKTYYAVWGDEQE